MNITKKSVVVAGLNVHVYSDAEAIVSSAPVVVLFFLHGRFGSAKELEPEVESLIQLTHREPKRVGQRDLLVVTFVRDLSSRGVNDALTSAMGVLRISGITGLAW